MGSDELDAEYNQETIVANLRKAFYFSFNLFELLAS